MADGVTGKVKIAAAPTTADVIKTITFSKGTLPTLGTAISADDITSWNAGTVPSLFYSAVSIPNVTDVTDVKVSYVTTSNVSVVTGVSQSGSTSSVIGIVTDGVLTFSKAITAVGNVSTSSTTVKSATATEKTVSKVTLGSALSASKITSWSAGTKPSLSYSAVSIPNITSVGSLPSLTKSTQTVIAEISSS